MVPTRYLSAFLAVAGPCLAQVQTYTFTRLDVPGAKATYAYKINNTGQILGSYADTTGMHCFLRSADAAVYTSFDTPDGNAYCQGINNLGQVAGFFIDTKQGTRGFIRDASGEFTTFDFPGQGVQPVVAAINDLGEIVGTFGQPPFGGPGYLRSPDGKFTNLEAPQLGDLDPEAINNKGEIAGWALYGSSQGPQHGFLRSADGVYRRFDLPGTTTSTRIYALNNAGQFAGSMVGGPGFVSNIDGSFMLFRDYQVFGINDTGQIVGSYLDVAGNSYAFLGTPGPGSTTPEIRTALPGVLPATAFGGGAFHPAVAPGTWIEIYGQNLAPVTRQWNSTDFTDGLAPTSLDGVRVAIGGVPAYLSYISPGQVNALVPSSVATGAAQVILTNGTQSTAPYTVQVAASRPALLSLPPDIGRDYARIVALFPDFTTYALPPDPFSNVPMRRPKAGDTIVFFGTGLGRVSPDVPIGRVAAGPASLVAPVQVTFFGHGNPVSGKISYAGLVPATVGLYQLNVVLPEIPLLPGETFEDDIPVYIYINGEQTPGPFLYMSIAK
jgi:uncharacterized protein (TIGR03437 family)